MIPEHMPERWPKALVVTPWIQSLADQLGVAPPRADDPIFPRLAQALIRDDVLADDLIGWIGATDGGRAQFDAVLENGVDVSPPAPGPLARFFDVIENRPVWADPALLSLGGEVHLRLGRVGRLAGGALGLLAGYRNSAVAKSLVTTGSLTEATGRRLAETSKFVVDVTDSNGMPRFSDGFKSTVRVRVVHAYVRRGLAKSPQWRPELWGPPIAIADSLGTALQFWIPILLAAPKMGYEVSRAEREGMMALWNYVGWLQGVPEDLLPRTLEEAYHLYCAIMMTVPAPDEDSKRLGQSFMAAAELAGDKKSWLRAKLVQGVAALLIPKDQQGDVDLEDTVFKAWPLLMRPLVRRQERKRLRDPALHARLVSEGRATAYEDLPAAMRSKAQFDPGQVVHNHSGLAA